MAVSREVAMMEEILAHAPEFKGASAYDDKEDFVTVLVAPGQAFALENHLDALIFRGIEIPPKILISEWDAP